MREFDLKPYAQAARQTAEELRNSLLAREFRPFERSLADASVAALYDYRHANGELVHELLTAPAEARQYRLAKLPPNERFLAIAAVAQMLFEAAAVLEAAEVWLVPEAGLREMPSNVHRILDAPLNEWGYVWPFPDPVRLKERAAPDEAN